MAIAADSTASRTGGRAAGSGIVVAGDRTASRRSARRHSFQVRALKYVLPLSILPVFTVYAGSVMQTLGWSTFIPELKIPSIVPDNLAMENPHYEGFNKDGGKYWVKAQKAIQDLRDMSNVGLVEISGELTGADKLKTFLTARRGTFNSKTNVLELFEKIDVKGETGLTAKMTRATIETKESIITSNEPVEVAMEAGLINADQMVVRQKVHEIAFSGNVRTHLKARPPAETPAGGEVSKSTEPFGNSGAPIDIQSTRLDVNDTTKIAIFTGDVRATQDKATLASPELQVTYEGAAMATPGQPAAPAGDAGGKVKRIVAKNPVTLTQSDTQTVTSRSADFDAAGQKAVLEGDVVMTELPDRRVVGDRAEMDQVADTVLVTGALVTLNQGVNELKGRRLWFNRATQKMQLTSPGGGRISALFQQSAERAAAAKTPAADSGEAASGFAFGASFKTDPNAPVNVEAAKLDVDDAQKQATFTGDVRAVQGEFVVTSAELVATYAGDGGLAATAPAADGAKSPTQLTRIQARRKVVVTSKAGQTATGDWADFDVKANTCTLGGDVVLKQGKNIVNGTKLVIDMTTGESVIKTEPGWAPAHSTSITDSKGKEIVLKGGRPSAVFYPGDLKNAAGKAAEQATEAATGWQSRATPAAKP